MTSRRLIALRRKAIAKARRVLIARSLAAGRTAAEAMRRAGYASTTARTGMIGHNGRRVSVRRHPGIAGLVLRYRVEDLARARIARCFDEAFALAKEQGKPRVMESAAKAKAKLLGLPVEEVRESLDGARACAAGN